MFILACEQNELAFPRHAVFSIVSMFFSYILNHLANDYSTGDIFNLSCFTTRTFPPLLPEWVICVSSLYFTFWPRTISYDLKEATLHWALCPDTTRPSKWSFKSCAYTTWPCPLNWDNQHLSFGNGIVSTKRQPIERETCTFLLRSLFGCLDFSTFWCLLVQHFWILLVLGTSPCS